MKNFTQISKIVALSIGLLSGVYSYAQVGIGTITPAGGSILDISSTNKGVLVPRVNITNLSNATVTGGNPDGLLVWSTNATNRGYHYWNTPTSAWVPIVPGTAISNDWTLTGNTITAAHFLGSTNNFDLNIRSNNTNRMRVQANGQTSVGFGAGAANAGDQFSSVAVGNGVGVAGYSGGTGSGVYGQNIAGGNAVYGISNSTGNAISGWSLGAGASGDAVHAEHDGSGNAVDAVAYGTGVGVYAENFFWSDYAMHAVDGSASIFADNTLIGFDAIIADTDDAVSNSLWARNENAIGTAVLGGSNNIYVYATSGSGVAGSGSKLGVYGYAGAGTTATANRGNSGGQFTLDTDSNPATNGTTNGTRASALIAGFDNASPDGVQAALNNYFGGYFVGGNHNSGVASYAYAGMKYGATGTGINGTNFKIIGNGNNSTIIRDKTNTPRILFSPEAPEILFEDYGIGQLVNGVAQITIDPIFKDAIYVDEKHPLKVFIQLEGDCNGVFVTNKSASGFTVKELASGTSNVSFSYHIVANRADEIDANGEIASKHVGLRFPIGPDRLPEQQLSVRKEGDNREGKDLSSKKRKSREVSQDTEVKELTEEELEVLRTKVEVTAKGQ
ncbi:MAG: hypothetical protein ACSHXF_12040 [Aquaticitalea sp.]